MPKNNPTAYRVRRATAGQQAEAMKPNTSPTPPPVTATEADARAIARGTGGKTKEEERNEVIDQEKFNPVVKSKPMTEDEIQAQGGLGAIAAKRRKK